MNNFKLSLLFRAVIIAISICGLAICILWYPFSASITTTGVVDAPMTIQQHIEFWVQVIFYWICSIPCFVILFFSWQITTYIKQDQIFTQKTVKKLNVSAIILFADIVLFLIGNIVFLALQWNGFAIMYFLVAIVGLVVATFIIILAKFVSRAAILQEEYEETI